jgi:hypothetical protein
LASCDRAEDNQRLGALGDGFGQRSFVGFMGKVLLASEEAQEWAALFCDMVADSALQHRVSVFEFVEGRTQRERAGDIERNFGADVRERAKVRGEDDSDHEQLNLSG